MSEKPNKKDLFFRIKYMGYCMANLPPQMEEWSYHDLIRSSKFYLARKWNKPMKDPVFRQYSEEELLVEYYAHKTVEDPEFAESIKNRVLGIETFEGEDDVAAAMEKEMELNKAEVEAYKQKMLLDKGDKIKDEEDESFSFKPE